MNLRRALGLFVTATLLLSVAAVCGCSGPCGGADEKVSPESLDVRGHATYRSETTDVAMDFAALIEPHYADPIYDGERLELPWEVPGPMTFGLTLVGPLELGTTPLTELSAVLCACESGFLQAPADARECFRNGVTTPARCEALVGDVFVREMSRECIDGDVFETCAERIDMDIVVPETDEGRFSGSILIRWFESVESRTCVEFLTIG
jgi:hypothetical protein